MRRAIVGNLVGVKSVMLLVLALVVLIGAGPALAQDLMFKTIKIDYFKFGSSVSTKANGQTLTASGVLCASDTDNDVWKEGADGKLDTSKNPVSFLSRTMSRPIIANMENNEQLYLAAIIEGVTPADVASLRSASKVPAENPVMQAIINMVTADFSAGLFASHTAKSVYSDVRPTYATTTFDIRGSVNGGVYSSTSVVVYWEVAGLKVSATNAIASKQSYSATMAIMKGGTVKRTGKSNLVGVETGINSAPAFHNNWASAGSSSWAADLDAVNKKGLLPGVNIGIRINKVWDTTSLPLFGGAGPIAPGDPGALNPMAFLSTSPNVPFQFRRGDQLGIQLQIDVREDLDGEPDEYFGAGGTDRLQLPASGVGKDLAGGQLIGGSIVLTGKKTDDNSTVLVSPTFLNLNTTGSAGGAAGSMQVIDVTAAIASNLITSSTFNTFQVLAVVSDEIVSSTRVYTNHAVDTAAPFYTATRAADEKNVPAGFIGQRAADRDEAIFGVEVFGNGESSSSSTNVRQWLNLAFQDESLSKGDVPAIWCDFIPATPALEDLGLVHARSIPAGHPVINIATQATLIQNLGSSSKILGASVVIRVKNNVTTTISSGGLIMSVSDDARNPALIYLSTTAGSTAYPLLDTTVKSYSVSSFTPLVANTLNPATVEIDNEPPKVQSAQLSVAGLPAGYWNSGLSTLSTFNLLRNSDDSAANIYTGGAKVIKRGTAKTTVTNDGRAQNGSPLRLLVNFHPVSDTSKIGDDLDAMPWVAKNQAERVAGFQQRFMAELANAQLGYATNGAGVNIGPGGSSDARWTIEDATLVFVTESANRTPSAANPTIGWVTFVESKGIPMANTDGDPQMESINGAPVTVALSDNVQNFYPNTNSTTIVVDVDGPTITKTDSNYWDGVAHITVRDGMGAAAATVLYITDTKGVKIPSSKWTAADPVQWTGTINGKAKRFYNSADIVGVTATGIAAGYSIIISGSFTIPDVDSQLNPGQPGVGGTDYFTTQIGGDAAGTLRSKSGFPFLFGLPTTPDGVQGAITVTDWTIDTAGTLFGRAFKTISADFGDFISEDSARDVLPDVTTVHDQTGALLNTSVVAPGQVVMATWFYMVDGNKNLNLKSSSDIRRVTLTARDLSGNVVRYGIPAATAAFVQPAVTILDFQINNPNRGIQGAVVQRHASYKDGVAAAVSLSQATVNLNNANAKIVAKIGDGVSKGGPLKQTDFLSADFTALGGTVEAPDQVTFANGTTVTDGRTVSPSSIIYATWTSDKFTVNKDSAGKATAKVVVRAIAQSLGVGESAPSTGVQVDHTPPDLIVSDILEKRADGANTAPVSDINGDGIVRPNQIVSVTAYFDMDAADKANANLVQFTPYLNQFGNPASQSFTWTGKVGAVTNKIRGVTVQFQVPGTQVSGFYKAIIGATDAAGNGDLDENPNLITVNASRPEVQSVVLSASNVINYATDKAGVFNAWRLIGKRIISDPNNPTFSDKHAVVRAGDALMVTAQININDDVFRQIYVAADFSSFSGSNYAAVVPAPYSNPHKDTIQQGTRLAGNIYYATWVHYIQPALTNQTIQDASVRIIARNPANVEAVGKSTYSPELAVDNKGPEVSQQIAFYKDGKITTATEINPKNNTAKGTAAARQVGRATAAIVVSATYADAGVRYGFAPSIFSALFFYKNLDVNTAEAQKAVYRLDNQGILDGGSGSSPALFTYSRKSGAWRDADDTTDGPMITSASVFTAQSAAEQARLKRATATVFNLWLGAHPSGKTYAVNDAKAVVFAEGAGKTDAKLPVSVSDVVGNRNTASSLTQVEIDGKEPYIQIGRSSQTYAQVQGATLDVAPGQTPYVHYVPAQYKANGKLERPTRVTNGTVVRLLTHLYDDPDKTDPIWFSVDGREFKAKASSFVWNSPTADQREDKALASRTDAGHETEYVYLTKIDPTKFSGNVANISVDLTVGLGKSNAGNSTIPYDTASVGNAISGAAYANSLATIIGAPNAGEKASVAMDATDTVDNWRYDIYARTGLEVDTQGPGMIEQFTTFMPTKDAVDKLGVLPVNRPGGLNANAGAWLVYAATLVIDGTHDLDFPLNKFTVNWADVFEFDTRRLERDKNFTGKKYIVSSATRSIVFVTNTIKIMDNANPRNADRITWRCEDMFGNVSSAQVPAGMELAIGARGPLATEISLKVDGKAQAVVGAGKLGIGARGPDSASAAFEVYPGAKIIVEATVTTINGEAPDTILLDASDLYPVGLRAMSDEVIPSATWMTPFGTIYARWEYIAYDVARLLPGAAKSVVTPVAATQMFFDQSNLNWLAYGVQYPTRTGKPGVGGRAFNGPIQGSTPAIIVSQNGITHAGVLRKADNAAPNNNANKNAANLQGGPKANKAMANFPAALNALQGLPFLTVQKDATAKRVAWVTVFVNDKDSLFPFEETLSNTFAVDTEPPRASYVYSVTQALHVNHRFMSGPRIGFPTAPNASRVDIMKPAPRVRKNDSVAVIVDITNALIDGTGNDAFRPLPGFIPADLNTGFFRLDPAVPSSIKDVTVDLSGFSTIPAAKNVSVFDPNAPVANPSVPNMLTLVSQGANKPTLIKANFSVKVSEGIGTDNITSNDPVEVTPTVVDDAGNIPVDTPYDKDVMLDNRNNNPAVGNDWVDLHPQTVLAVDNHGPFISGTVAAQIIEGTAMVYNALTGTRDVLKPGALLLDGASISAGTVLRVTVTVTDQVDHPLDLVIDPQNNYGPMKLTAEGLKLASSILKSRDAKLSGPDSISVPFQITMPPKEIGKSTKAFRFIIQATDTVGNMSEKTSTEMFQFDANPDVEYFDAAGAPLVANVVNVNAGPAPQKIVVAKALDIGGIESIEWVADAVEGVTFSARDAAGNLIEGTKFEAGGIQESQLDLYALIPVVTGGVTPFNAYAVVTDIEHNTNELNVVTVNINQPPIIAASIPFEATNDSNIKTTGTLLESTGIGYNTAYADIREVTIEEGTDVTLSVVATDQNAANTVTLSATGSAVISPKIKEGLARITSGAGTGRLDFSFKSGYLAVTGEAKSATYALDVKAQDGTTIAGDTTRLIFNVIAKSATPLVSVHSILVDNATKTPVAGMQVDVKEGSKITVVFKGQDPGNETLSVLLKPIPATVPAQMSQSFSADGIVYATFSYTTKFTDADVPEIGYDSPLDPMFASFEVSNASFSNSALVPIDIINVSQAPIITATATVDIENPVVVADKGVINAKMKSQVVIDFKSVDPDGDAVLTTLTPTVTPAEYSSSYRAVSIGLGTFESTLTVIVPETVTPENASATVVYTSRDNTGKERTITLYIVVDTGPLPPAPADIDNLVVAQGFGATGIVHFKNIDPNVKEIGGKTVALTSTYRALQVANTAFLASIGGGSGREAYVDLGDVDGDGDLDLVTSLGPVTEADGLFPNIIVARDAKTRVVTAHSFVSFQVGAYAGGDTPIAVGDFIGSATADQIACAQGFGGNNVIRIYQATGRPAPNGWAVVAQFNGLAGGALTNNANNGVTLAAGDLTGDGRDELVVCQTNSASSRTQFTVIGFTATGAIDFRTPGVAFARRFQGNGGINAAVVDLNGDGKNELVFASTGNTRDFTVDVARNDALLNVISILVPVVEAGKVTSYTTPARNVLAIFSVANGPAGAQSIAGVEGNGLKDGTELVLGTKAVLNVDGTTITPVIAPPQAKFSFTKVNFDGTAVNGMSAFLGQANNGFPAFPVDINPVGGVNVAAGQTD